MYRDGRLRDFAERPEHGWIREIRVALGMTSRQLAHRMGESQSAVSQLEQSEVSDRARLETLRRAADALDCNLVYTLVPKTSLEGTLITRARVLAARDLAEADPATDPDVLDQRIEHTAGRLVDGGRLWDGRDSH